MKSIQNSIEHYKAMLNEIEDSVGETDIEGNITFITDVGCRLWGYDREEVVGHSYKAFVDENTIPLVRKMYNKVYRTKKPVRFIHDVIRKGGSKIIVEDSVSPILKSNGEMTGFRAVQRDVTEQEMARKEIKAHRRRLEAIFSGVADAIIMVDMDMRVIEANKSLEEICGYSINGIRGKLFESLKGNCCKKCFEILEQTITQKKNISGYRIECAHRGKDHQTVSINSSPVLDQGGGLMGAVMVVRDTTMLDDLQKKLQERHLFHNIIGQSKQMQEIYSLLDHLKDLDTTVLVLGESGTGKELVAKAAHYGGRRAEKPFIAVNCSALSENLLESELFGHAKGSFTGAVKDRIGRFEAAEGGTILLDEIGDISPLIQLKLLRVLQEKVIERVGEQTLRHVDTRIIACTNKDLKKKVAKGEFREDLFYRLKVVQVELPPLRERLEDIPLLVNHFIVEFNKKFNQNIEGVSQDVLGLFMAYNWPGNVRELEHAIEHAFILCRSTSITLAHLPVDIIKAADQNKRSVQIIQKGKKSVGKGDILKALAKTGGNKAKAARLLGINRRTIYRKMDNHR